MPMPEGGDADWGALIALLLVVFIVWASFQ